MLGFTGWFWNRNNIRLLPLTHTSPEIIRKQKGRNSSLLGGEAGPLRAFPHSQPHPEGGEIRFRPGLQRFIPAVGRGKA